ncbi:MULTISPECIES: hypothetical protein [unclassified Pseudoalteromonas]|uniref:hypothetical protein n=1 Tax=unclassified Pseudoalteromonas TaxID=194690 RepID=UPI0005A7641E|nr:MULTISPECIES: hypothetical protein [unclassified Pseudoalteromonas]
MKFSIALICALLLLIPLNNNAADKKLNIVRTIAPQSDTDTAHLFFTDIIQLALDKSQDKYGQSQLVLSTISMTQGRWFRMLKNRIYLDITWGGANKEREESFTAIPIDLLGGILGVRALIIRKADRKKFSNITTMEQLKTLTACQAEHWPDTTILENAELKILKVNKFEINFKMLEKGRCDYFPRGIHEGYSEIEKYQIMWGNKLVIFDEFLLVYPFNMWFYVDNKNYALASQISYGLKQAIKDGSFKTKLENHPITSHLFPLSKWGGKRLFLLKNDQQDLQATQDAWWLLKEFPFYKDIKFK